MSCTLSLSHAHVEYVNACALSTFANIHLLRLPIFQILAALFEKIVLGISQVE